MNLGAWYCYRLNNEDKTLIHSLWIFKGSKPDSEDVKKMFHPFVIEEYMYEGRCIGCQNDCLGQIEHMYCPAGCLHDKDECDLCLMEYHEE